MFTRCNILCTYRVANETQKGGIMKVSKKKISKVKKDLIKKGKDEDFLDMIMKDSVKPKRMF